MDVMKQDFENEVYEFEKCYEKFIKRAQAKDSNFYERIKIAKKDSNYNIMDFKERLLTLLVDCGVDEYISKELSLFQRSGKTEYERWFNGKEKNKIEAFYDRFINKYELGKSVSILNSNISSPRKFKIELLRYPFNILW